MLQVLPDSDISRTWLGFDKSFFFPEFPSDCLFSQGTKRVLGSRPSISPCETAEYLSTATKNNDQFRMRSWMKPHKYQSRNSGLSSRKPMVQRPVWRENSGYWIPSFSPSEPQLNKLQPFESQHQPMPQAQYIPAEGGRTLSLPRSDGQYMESNAKCLGSAGPSFDSKEIKLEDPFPNILHPIPKHNLFQATNNIASFMEVDDPEETAPAFDCIEGPKQENAPLELASHSFSQAPGLMNDSTDGMSPFQFKGSPGTSSVATEEHYTPSPGTLSWPTFKLPSQWSTQQQETLSGELNWSSMPFVPNGAQNSRLGSTGFDNSTSMDDRMSALPLSNDMHNTGSTFASGTCRPDFNFAFSKEQAAVNPAFQFFGVPVINTVDNENVYPLDHPVYSDSQPRVEPDRREFQEQRDLLTVSCYSENRNAFLIECKRRGLSYKDIKQLGGFKEAESTLRGRFRTLTKSKEQRVRKPQWQPRDVSYQSGMGRKYLLTRC